MPNKEPELFGSEMPQQIKSPRRRTVTDLAKKIVYAIRAIGYPATEDEIIDQGERMNRDNMHDYKLGTVSNIRNVIQRHCSAYSEFKNHNYEDIFIRIKRPGERVRFWVKDWYRP